MKLLLLSEERMVPEQEVLLRNFLRLKMHVFMLRS